MPSNNVKVTELQKNKMLRFFERYPLLVNGMSMIPAKRRQAHKLWRELAVILNNCDPDGSKKSISSWLKTLTDLKSKAKKRVLARARTISDFQRRLYELAFGPLDEETSKAMKSREKYSVNDTSMDVCDDASPKSKVKEKDMEGGEYLDLGKECENEYGATNHHSERGASRVTNANRLRTTYIQKHTMLQFLEHNFLKDPISYRDSLDNDKLWVELTMILNNCDGPKRKKQRWSKIWSDVKRLLRNKIMRNVKLTPFDERLVIFLNKLKEKKDSERGEEANLIRDFFSTEDDTVGGPRTTILQKWKMLQFWENNILDEKWSDKNSSPWQNLTKVLNNCAGPKRTSKAWAQIWNHYKIRVQRKSAKNLEMNVFEQCIAKLIGKTDKPYAGNHLNKNKDGSDSEPQGVEHEEMENVEYLDTEEQLEETVDDIEIETEPEMEEQPTKKIKLSQMSAMQKFKMLEFWRQYIKYYNKYPTLRLAERTLLWKKLTDILNKCVGPKTSREEWKKVWSRAKCETKRKLEQGLPLSSWEKQLMITTKNLLGEHSVEETESTRVEDRQKLGTAAKCNATVSYKQSPEPSFTKHKYGMLNFWNMNIHHIETGSMEDRRIKKQKLWRELTLMLNSMEGPQKSGKEWAQAWTYTKYVTKKKHSEGKPLSDFQKKLLEFMIKHEDLYIRIHNPVEERMTSDRTPIDNSIGVFQTNPEEPAKSPELCAEESLVIPAGAVWRKTGNASTKSPMEETLDLEMDIFPEVSTCISGMDLSELDKEMDEELGSGRNQSETTLEQRYKMLRFWQANEKSYEEANSKSGRVDFLWNQLAEILNECVGPWKTTKEWKKVWYDSKRDVKMKSSQNLPMTDLEKSYLCFFSDCELDKDKRPDKGTDVVTTIENGVVDDEVERIGDNNESNQREHCAGCDGNKYAASDGALLRSMLTSHIEGGFEIQRETLELHRSHLVVQEQMLADREELVRSLNTGVRVMMGIAGKVARDVSSENSQRSEVSNSTLANETKKPKTIFIRRNNLIPSKPPPLKENLEVNEFESFAKNVELQLKKLPHKNASETKKMIENVLEERSRKTVDLMEDTYVIHVVDE